MNVSGAVRAAAWVVFVLAACPLWWLAIPLHHLRLLALRVLGSPGFLTRILDAPHQLYVRWWSRLGLGIFGIRLDVVSGAERLRRRACDAPRVVVWNHTSNLDPVFCSALASEAKFLFKAGLHAAWFYTIPAIFSGHMAVNRNSKGSRAGTVAQLLRNVVERDNSVALAPEGTRNRGDPREMLPFKAGAFIVSQKARAPILPVIFSHADALWTRGSALPGVGHVAVRVLEPIVPKEGETAEELLGRVRCAMDAAIKSPPPPRRAVSATERVMLHIPAVSVLTALGAVLLLAFAL